MTDKPKIAIYWLGACGGCDSSLLDLGEFLPKLATMAEIVLWPAALDFKHDRIRDLADGALAFSIVSGCVRNSGHRDIAELLRAKSRLLLACGSCACFGGVPGLANLRPGGEIPEWVYLHAPTVTNPSGTIPEGVCEVNGARLHLPVIYNHVYSLGQVVEVDYLLPGCPPPVSLVLPAIMALLHENLPQKGSTLAAAKPLCDSCPRNLGRPARIEIKKICNVHEADVPPEDCFLAHGVICLGPATRGGCGGSCLAANSPCRGCFGPVDGVPDAGVRFLSSLATIISPVDEAHLGGIIGSFQDSAGYAFRFTEAVSILGSRSLPDRDKI